MITTVFINKCALWQNRGKGKLKPCFLTSRELGILPVEVGDLFSFCQCGKLNSSPDSTTMGLYTTWQWPAFVWWLQMACKQRRCEFWAQVCHHSGGGGWGQPNLFVWEAESCQDMSRQLLLMSRRSAQPLEKWWDVLGVAVILCHPNSFSSSPFRYFW